MKKMNLELLCKIAQDITDTLEKQGNGDDYLVGHQLEALNLVLSTMLVEYGIPLKVGQQALEMAYRQILDRWESEGETESVH
jgi:hypothetical protein